MSNAAWLLAYPEFGDLGAREDEVDGGEIIGMVVWCEGMGEAEVLLHPNFLAADRVTKLDALQDAISVLQREYDRLLGGAA